MKQILVPYYDRETSARALDLAMAVVRPEARGFIQGMHVKQQPPVIAGEGITLPGDYLAQLSEQSELQSRKSREDFLQQAAELGLAQGRLMSGDSGHRVGWIEMEGIETQAVGEYGRLFDAVVVSRGRHPSDWRAVCEAALFDSGRPLLVAGEQPAANLAERIMIAWNRSTETARALSCSMDMLRIAGEVLVLEVQGATVSGPDGRQLTEHLAAQDIKVRFREEDLAGATSGTVILRVAKEYNATLLVKGAFTQGRLRQLIFGGATKEVMESADIPVLFAH